MNKSLRIPTGAILMHAGSTIPNGWLICDGSTFSSNDYPKLAELLSNNYGAISGTDYRLPDFRGRIPISNINTTTNNRRVGLESVKLTANQSPVAPHSHSDTVNVGAHTHTSTARRPSNSPNTTQGAASTGGSMLLGSTSPSYSSSTTPGAPILTVNTNTGADAAQEHPNVMPSLVINFIIKTD